MVIQLRGGRVYDPASGFDGQICDIFIRDQEILAVHPHAPGDGSSNDHAFDGVAAAFDQVASEPIDADTVLDVSGKFVMAGAIDLHTHIGGGKANIARLLLPELMSTRAEQNELGYSMRDPLLRERIDNFLPPAPMVGRRYLEMGYTACFEPAMIACNARGTHAELADTPGIDTGAYVVLGNDDALLKLIRDRAPQPIINAYVASMVMATRAMGVKVVNAGGINAFKFNQRKLDVDQPHPHYGVTPSQIIRHLATAVDEIGLPQPLHVHASNLGVAGNIESALKTVAAANGHRIHLTHVQFHSYGNAGPHGFSSAAEQIARAIEQYPNLTIDVGQVMFGQTVTISADTMHQFASRSLAKPRKSVILDIECQAGCGVVPFRYQNRRYVNALQWAIGLELFLMVDDPSRVFLTTDHPNGGPFTTYPHLIRLLMDKSFRETALAEIHADAKASSQLAGIDREYSLAEIAMMTRSAPAKFLGLNQHGSLKPGSVADVVVYGQRSDWEQTFAAPTHVFRRGRLVVKDGRMIDCAPKVTHSVDVKIDSGDLSSYQLPQSLAPIPISADEMQAQLGVPLKVHRPLEKQGGG